MIELQRTYHGCQIISVYGDNAETHDVFDGENSIGNCETLAAAIAMAKLRNPPPVPKPYIDPDDDEETIP